MAICHDFSSVIGGRQAELAPPTHTPVTQRLEWSPYKGLNRGSSPRRSTKVTYRRGRWVAEWQ